MVEAMDQAVGTVLHKLDELGLSDHTIVIFMSDNGRCSRRPRAIPRRICRFRGKRLAL